MNIDRSKSKLSTIALITVLAISVTLAALPAAVAQEVQSKATVCYLGAMPNPIGVGQEVLLHVGITDYLSSVEMGWENLTITVTDPEGIESTIGPLRTDSTGGTGWVIIPDKVGKYTLQAHFTTQRVLVTPFMFGSPYNLTYLASDSEELELEVLDHDIPYYPDNLLPSEYWTRPIDAQLREWSAISASWVRDPENLYAPYNDGPETAHILWTKELDYMGGLAGGELDGLSYGIGDAYEGKFPSRFIVSGRLYYTTGGADNDAPIVYYCVDLHTGEELWSKVFMDNQSISFAQVFYWNAANYHGAFAYLYVSVTSGGNMFGVGASTSWYAFDAYTGDWRFTIENVPSGTNLYDSDNHIYILNVDTTNGWMALWNMTDVCLSKAVGYDVASWGNSVHGQTFDAAEDTPAVQSAWSWNVTIPTDLEGSVYAAWYDDRVVGATQSTEEVTVWGLNLNSTEGDIGDVLFNNTWEAPAYWAETNVTVYGLMGMSGGWVAWSQEEHVAILWVKETREHFAFSLETGDYLWNTETQYYLDAFMDFIPRDHNIAYGRLFSVSVSGIVYCYDITDGRLLWDYPADDPYSEMLWSNNWWMKMQFITDGKIYMTHIEHSPIDPRPRGAPYICLNIEDGSVVWRIDGAFRGTHWGGAGIIGDSIIATMSTYDQRLYAIGKGASATTVTAEPKVVSQGTAVIIEGTVTDVSPGTEDTALQLRFSNGVPAVSDESMSEWMKYVYMQFGIPADTTGVPVSIDVVDSDGVWSNIGTVTSDMSGTYSTMWTPEAEGEYTIVATFMGSGGYYASYAETVVGVGPAAAEYQEAEAAPDYTPMFTGILVAVAIAIIIGIVNLFALRKQK